MKTLWASLCLSLALSGSALAYQPIILKAEKGQQPTRNLKAIAKTMENLKAGTKRSFGKWMAETDHDGVAIVKTRRKSDIKWFFSHLGPAQRHVVIK